MTKLFSHGKSSNYEKTELYIHGKDGKIHCKDNHGSDHILNVLKIMYENRMESARISAIMSLHFPRSFETGCEAGQTASAFFNRGKAMKTIVYVDGFNLYYGSVKDTPHKWLNIHRMCELLLPNNQIVGMKYFTAKVLSRKRDPQKHLRQQIYLRALKTLPDFEVIYGHYSEHPKWMRLANPQPGQAKYVEVIKTEEKGSDVNLAVNLLNDGYQGKYQLATIVTNDSDLLAVVQIVQKDLGLKVGILNPQKHPSKELKNEALFIKKIRPGVIKASQFPKTMMDAKGSFYKPKEW